MHVWASSSEFGTYHLCEQRRLKVKICHDGMLEDTDSLDTPRIIKVIILSVVSAQRQSKKTKRTINHP